MKDIEQSISNGKRLTPEQIRRKVNEDAEDNNTSTQQPNSTPIQRTKLGRKKEAEQYVENSNNSKPQSQSTTEQQNETTTQPTETVDEEQQPTQPTEQTEQPAKENKSTHTNAPLSFIQTIVVILLSGGILFTFGVWTWKALDNSDKDMIYTDITENMNILNGGENIAGTENIVWDYINPEAEVEVSVTLPYTYDKKTKTATFEYNGIKMNYDTTQSDFKFRKEGNLVAHIITDNYGQLISYNVVDVLKK